MIESYEELNAMLTEQGWILECYSPLEISKRDDPESRATGEAAEIVVDYLWTENEG